MSFMPAGEDDEDDFDWELDGGFIDCSNGVHNTRQGSSSINGSNLTTLTSSHDVSPVSQERSAAHSGSIFSSPPKPQRRGYTRRTEKQSVIVTSEELRIAILKNNIDIAEKYVDLGLPLDEVLRSGWTVLMYAANYARPNFVRFFLKHGASATYCCDMFTPLMCACSATSGDSQAVEECVKILIDAGVNVDSRDRFHTTALMLASQEGYLPAVKLLITAGAKVNMQNNQGWTALTMATQRSRASVVVELLDAGADTNIQHLDKLTVKDMAAHLPTDDMLALLERRPVNTSSQSSRPIQGVSYKGQEIGTSVNCDITANNCLLDSGSTNARLTDLRYGELEVFLLGLDLGHLVCLFQEQLIDLQLLMTLTEQDLINAGVEQVGARKKILDAVQAVHKKDWQPSSLVSVHYNKRISCADAVAMMANSSRHLRYICSTMVYIKEQLKKHPETIMQSTDRVSPSQFHRHAEDATKNVHSLTTQLEVLKTRLEKEMTRSHPHPSDVIPDKDNRKIVSAKWRHRLASSVVLIACLAAVTWWGREGFAQRVSRIGNIVNKSR